MMAERRDAPYPQLKKTHTMAHAGRPWTDYKPPAAAPVWAAIEGSGRYHVLRAAVDLDLFDTLRDIGPSTVDAVAEQWRASPPHVGSLLDSAVALGFLEQVNGVYELNDTAKRYLVSDGPACMADLVPVAPGPLVNWSQLADTVLNGRPATPIEDDPEAFYIPLVEGTFTTMWRCATRADLRVRTRPTRHCVRSISARAAPPVEHRDADRLPCGIGSGQRPSRRARSCPAQDSRVRGGRSLRVPAGRLPRDRHRTLVVRPCGAGPRLPRRGRRWRNTVDRSGIRRAAAGWPSHRRRLLRRPRAKVNPHAVLMGATMMASTVHGFTYTTDEFGGWLRAAGFGHLRMVEPIGFQQCIVATKPW